MGEARHKELLIGCSSLGVLHAIVMTRFALGPEWAPLAVYLVDFPLAYPLREWFGLEPPLIWILCIPACSLLYPWLLYRLVRLVGKWRESGNAKA